VHGEEKHPYRKRLTPAHFLIEVANKGLRGYGTWKKIRKNIGQELTQRAQRRGAQRTRRGEDGSRSVLWA
jgi:hypothetical protein